MPRRSLARLYKAEFTGYSLAKFQHDLLAGLTVAAVAIGFIRDRVHALLAGAPA